MIVVDKLIEWQQISEQLAALRNKELELRKEIFAESFQSPREGVNKFPLANDFGLVATYKLTRRIKDEQPLKDMGLLKYKPELDLKKYRDLSDEQRRVVDASLVISPATPTLEIK